MFSSRPILLVFALLATYAWGAVIRPRGGAWEKSDLTRRQDEPKAAEVLLHCTVPGTAAITFDDGPYIWTRQIVDILDAAGANATFYFNGNNWRCIYEEEMVSAVKYAYDHGHQIASHTWSHQHLNTLNQFQIEQQFWLLEEAVYRITGAYPAFTRPPFGEYNDLVLRVAGARGQTITNWDFDSLDTAGSTGAQSLASYARLASSNPPSILTLNHEIIPSTVEILPQLIRDLQAAGYRLTTVADCLGMEPYKFVGQPEERHAGWDYNCRLH